MRKFIIGLLAWSLLFISAAAPMYASNNNETTPSSISLSELGHFIDNYVSGYIDRTTLGASVVVIKDNNIVHAKGYGHTDVSKQTDIDAYSTVFEWGSISKLFVWVSALQLVEQGKLDLNTPISTYLPKEQMPKLQYSEPITMLHLMNHNAGFEEYIVGLISESKEDIKPLATALKEDQPYQAYRPGEVVAYSNYSTSLAALIIENITNQSYEAYVKEHIFAPLEMNDTIVTIANDDDLLKIKDKRATGYVSYESGAFTEMPFAYLSLYPSGSLNGPATDLAKFALALLAKTETDNKLFNSLSTLDLLYTTTHRADSEIAGIAHGFWEYSGAYKSYSHGGNTSGFATNFHVVPDDDFAVVILTNQVQELAITYGLSDELLKSNEVRSQLERLPLNRELNYDSTYTSARNTNHSFTKVYFNLSSLTIKPNYDKELLEINFAGQTALYEQIVPNGFRLLKGSPLFLTLKDIYLYTDGSTITQIGAPFADYITASISMPFILLSFLLLTVLALYALTFSIVYTVKAIRYKASLKPHAIILFLQAVSFINTVILAVRLMVNANRTASDIILHFYINYGVLALSVILISYLTFKSFKQKSLITYHYIATVLVIALYQALLLFWKFYSL